MTEMATSAPTAHIMVHARRIYSEYLEMPGLRLTSAQAQRLMGVEAAVCIDALDLLVDAGFLRLTTTGQYVRLTDGLIVSPFRMAKAHPVQAHSGEKKVS
jgi:hypothetical protein